MQGENFHKIKKLKPAVGALDIIWDYSKKMGRNTWVVIIVIANNY